MATQMLTHQPHCVELFSVFAPKYSLRNGFTAYAVLSPATNSSCHRRLQIRVWPNPVGLGKTSASLAPATGVGTTRFCRTRDTSFVLHAAGSLTSLTRPAIAIAPALSRPPHPVPRS